MANRRRSSAEDWVEVGYELLGDGGVAAVKIDVIAKRLGVSRSGFYHRFPDRRSFLEAINDRWMTDGFDAYHRAGQLPTPLERLRGIGYYGLGNRRLRRADQWLLVRGPAHRDLSDEFTTVAERATEWVAPHFVDLGFGEDEAARRAYVYFLAYLGLGAELGARRNEVEPDELRRLVDLIVDVVSAPQLIPRGITVEP